MGTGTYLDSLRFRLHVGERLGVSPGSVEANVVGEHGTSSVFLCSSARIGGMPVRELLAQRRIEFETFRKDVRFANITIIEGIGASQYGIGILSARIAEAILRDERAVFPAGSYNPRFGTTVSLPSIVGRQGVVEVLDPEMSDEERRALERSAERLRETVREHIGAR
jgi:L-lactate dehydrogenase